ncbi:alpha/beta fold hydrolase [Streptomyces sp. NPDC058008]|uniref:alpha/beta fold hydrolase n=1 Tax=Streptomyces sp. NPDC058008 TaxID=3346303 RepID=UPI0036EA0C03
MLAYDIRGRGPGLVLLHGIGSTGTGTWGALADRLAADHTVVLPDLPGSGRSPLPGGPLETGALADQVLATARAAGLGDFVVGGASVGAAVAVAVAANGPDRVRGLFTLAGFARPRTALWLSLELWASVAARQDGSSGSFLTSLCFSEEHLASLTPEEEQRLAARPVASAPGTSQQIALALGLDVRRLLPAVAAPTLVVAAMGDRLVAPEHSVELAEGIPGARLAAVRGGHAATVEEPERIGDILTDFLREVHGRGAGTPEPPAFQRTSGTGRRFLPALPRPARP